MEIDSGSNVRPIEEDVSKKSALVILDSAEAYRVTPRLSNWADIGPMAPLLR